MDLLEKGRRKEQEKKKDNLQCIQFVIVGTYNGYKRATDQRNNVNKAIKKIILKKWMDERTH